MVMKKIIFTFTKQYKKPSQSWYTKDQRFYQLRNTQLLYNFGMYATIFGLCYAVVPVYRIFCEHMGLEGDLKQKDYSVLDKKVILHRKFKITFKSEIDPDLNWEFEPENKEMIINAGETALTFYKAINHEEKPIIGFATYQVFPEDALLYFSKIQCFCFNQQMLSPQEEVFLPIYFYLEPEIQDDKNLGHIKEIKIIYKAKKQDLVKLIQEETQKIEQNKRILQQMRDEKKQKQLNITI